MNCEADKTFAPVEEISRRDFARRIMWIVVQLILVYCLADEFQPFFYQAF